MATIQTVTTANMSSFLKDKPSDLKATPIEDVPKVHPSPDSLKPI